MNSNKRVLNGWGGCSGKQDVASYPFVSHRHQHWPGKLRLQFWTAVLFKLRLVAFSLGRPHTINVATTMHVYDDVTSPQNAVTDLLASTVTQVEERVDLKVFRPFTLKTGHKLRSFAKVGVITVAQRPQGVESKHSIIRDGLFASSKHISSWCVVVVVWHIYGTRENWLSPVLVEVVSAPGYHFRSATVLPNTTNSFLTLK